MNITTLELALIDYVKSEIMPLVQPTTIKVLGFNIPISKELMQVGIGVFTGMSELNLEQYIPVLQNFKIVDENGNIDKEKLFKTLKEEFKKVGNKLSIGMIDLTEQDIDKFIEYVNKYE